MFYKKPASSLGNGYNQFDTKTMGWVETRPQPRTQPMMMNSGYPVLDLIAGLVQVFNREPMTTPPYVPPQ